MKKLLAFFHQKSDQTGFSLIELMVVMTIIGILAITTLSDTTGPVREAQATQAKNRMGQIAERAKQLTVTTTFRFTEGVVYTVRKTSDDSDTDLTGMLDLSLEDSETFEYVAYINSEASQICLKAVFVDPDGTVQANRFILYSKTSVEGSPYWNSGGHFNTRAFVSDDASARETDAGDCNTLGVPS